ncbi:hypothetical protein FA15DRAFT_661232 [Coprinopsis marcescibilis]|uniref:Uncharacterized protein n=1 Tax=Coprinopsis marcescibilis TaxID=230819 RepID=A0A5C3KD19_COPMA|nr:hypothetical protein FA15DRAFT_661232 [Coprinopsis marcescibilis]
MILLSLGLGLLAPLIPGLAVHKQDLAQAIPFLDSISTPDLKTVPFISTRSAALIAGQCALGIIGACLLGIHPSADGVKDSRWRRLMNRFKTAYGFLLFPEFLVWQAIRQRAGANALVKEFDSSLNWGKAHAHLIQMGGLVLHEADFKFQFGRSASPVRILSYEELSELVENGETKWPLIFQKDIAKLSSKHPFLTAFALFQTTSVLMRTIIRASHGLSISHVELLSSFYILVGWTLSLLLWDKPHSIEGIIPVNRRISESQKTDAVPYSLPIHSEQKQKRGKHSSRNSLDAQQSSLPSFSAPQERKQIVEIEEPRFQIRHSHVEKGLMLMLDSFWWLFSDAAGMMDPDCVKSIHETADSYPSLDYDDVDVDKFSSELALRPNRLYAYQSETEEQDFMPSNPVRKAGYSNLTTMVALASVFAVACNLASWLPASSSSTMKSSFFFEFPGLMERVLYSGSATISALSLIACLAIAYHIPERDGFMTMEVSYPFMAFSLFLQVASRAFVLVSSGTMLQNVVTTSLPSTMGMAITT